MDTQQTSVSSGQTASKFKRCALTLLAIGAAASISAGFSWTWNQSKYGVICGTVAGLTGLFFGFMNNADLAKSGWKRDDRRRSRSLFSDMKRKSEMSGFIAGIISGFACSLIDPSFSTVGNFAGSAFAGMSGAALSILPDIPARRKMKGDVLQSPQKNDCEL